MSVWSRFLTGGLLLGALDAAVGCNSVLGIEQATLDTAPAPECHSGQGYDLRACTQSTSCEACIGSACKHDEYTGCLANSECRKALADYRTCQTGDCRDPTGTCSGCLLGGAGAECFADCAGACQGAELVSLCEIFCSCMDTNCAGKLTDCRTTCRDSAQPWRTNCFLTHCELAIGPGDDHCLHAADTLPACPDQPPEPDPDCDDPNKGLVGYGCSSGDDCCSGFCPNKFCGSL